MASHPARRFSKLAIMVALAISCAADGLVYAVEDSKNQPEKKSAEVASPVSKELVSMFDAKEFSYKPAAGPEQKFRFLLFRPAKRKTGGKFPLIVWLHGYGAFEMQAIDVGQLLYVEPLLIKDTSRPELYPFYILAVQCTVDNDEWFVGAENAAHKAGRMTPGEATIRIITELLDSEPIDADRVYLSGICLGGTGALEMAVLRPDLFAAISCFSAEGLNRKSLEKLVNIPIWAFRNPTDSADSIQRAIRTLKELGGRCAFTATYWGGHNSWSQAYIDYDVLPWMLSQQRGMPDRNLPGTPPLRIRWRQFKSDYRRYLQWEQWKPRLITIGAFVVIIWLCRRELRRHREVRMDASA